jgi:hypothetical protein
MLLSNLRLQLLAVWLLPSIWLLFVASNTIARWHLPPCSLLRVVGCADTAIMVDVHVPARSIVVVVDAESTSHGEEPCAEGSSSSGKSDTWAIAAHTLADVETTVDVVGRAESADVCLAVCRQAVQQLRMCRRNNVTSGH